MTLVDRTLLTWSDGINPRPATVAIRYDDQTLEMRSVVFANPTSSRLAITFTFAPSGVTRTDTCDPYTSSSRTLPRNQWYWAVDPEEPDVLHLPDGYSIGMTAGPAGAQAH